jgi:hypothetical protein
MMKLSLSLSAKNRNLQTEHSLRRKAIEGILNAIDPLNAASGPRKCSQLFFHPDILLWLISQIFEQIGSLEISVWVNDRI